MKFMLVAVIVLDIILGAPNSASADGVTAVAISPDSSLIAIGHRPDGKATLWNLQTGRLVRTFSGHKVIKYGTAIEAVSFSPDGKFLLTGGEDETARLWEVASGRELWVLAGHKGSVRDCSFSPDGNFILTGAVWGSAILWDIRQRSQKYVFKVGGIITNHASFSPDGKYIASMGPCRAPTVGNTYCHDVILWDAENFKEIRVYEGHPYEIETLSFSPDGRYLLTGAGAFDNSLKLWEVETGRLLRTIKGAINGVRKAAFSPSGDLVVSGRTSFKEIEKGKVYVSGSFMLWDVQTGREVLAFGQHDAGVSCVCFSSDGKYILSGSYDDTAKLWDSKTGQLIRVFTSFPK